MKQKIVHKSEVRYKRKVLRKDKNAEDDEQRAETNRYVMHGFRVTLYETRCLRYERADNKEWDAEAKRVRKEERECRAWL